MSDVLLLNEVAEILRIRPDQVDTLLDEGELRFFEVCGERRIHSLDVADYVARQTAAAQARVWSNPATLAKALTGTLVRVRPCERTCQGLLPSRAPSVP